LSRDPPRLEVPAGSPASLRRIPGRAPTAGPTVIARIGASFLLTPLATGPRFKSEALQRSRTESDPGPRRQLGASREAILALAVVPAAAGTQGEFTQRPVCESSPPPGAIAGVDGRSRSATPVPGESAATRAHQNDLVWRARRKSGRAATRTAGNGPFDLTPPLAPPT